MRPLLAEAERDHGVESAEVADVLDELAVALRRGGKTADPEALTVCERSLRIKGRLFGSDDPRYATSLYNLGLLHMLRSELDQALAVLQQSLDIRTRALGPDDPAVAQSLRAMGSVQSRLGNVWEGLPLQERAVAIERVTLEATDPQRIYGVEALGNARYSVGDFAGAIPLLGEAISLWERSPTPNQGAIANCRHTLGVVYSVLGDHRQARTNLDQALRAMQAEFRADHPLMVLTLDALAELYAETGDPAAAKAALRRAIRILERAAPRDPNLGWSRMKLAWVYLDEGDTARADGMFQQALREQESASGPGHAETWYTLLGLAKVAGMSGETQRAREYFDRTATLVRDTSGPRHPDLGQTLREYSAFLLASGDSLAAFETALQAADINREHLRLTARRTAERQGLLYTEWLRTGLDVVLAALSGPVGSGSDENVRRAWDAVIRSRAVVLDEVTERARVAGATGELSDLARQLEGARDRLANLLVRGAAGEAPDKSRALLDRARDDVDRAERDLAGRSAAFRTDQSRAALGWDQVAAALPTGSALVSFVCYGEDSARTYCAFAMGKDRVPREVRLGSTKEIDLLIARWRKLAGTAPAGSAREAANAEAACRRAGQALRARVWDPVSSVVAGSRIVLVVPDGPIHLLNLAALPAEGGGYLVESPATLHYLSAERAIVTAGEVTPQGVGLLAVGGASFDEPETQASPDSLAPALAAGPSAPAATAPVYRDALKGCEAFRSFRFEPLPATSQEVEEIRQLWGRPGETVVLKGRSAGERSVKELLPGRRVAHFATHGFFLNDLCGGASGADASGTRGIGGVSKASGTHAKAPAGAYRIQLSGLALAGANQRGAAAPDEEDGILTADEIASLNLLGLDWAVLSACHTGVGEIKSGEGVLGLRRAFEIAGANALIMSLWPVEDRSTREWMSLLYEGRFRRDLETAEAVRQADLGVLKSRRAQGLSTHPFYWAAFVGAGNWR